MRKTTGIAFAVALMGLFATGCFNIGNSASDCTTGETCICNGIGNCFRTCEGGGCNFECSGIGNCILDCPEGGCTMSCEGTGNCELSCAGGDCQTDCRNTGNCLCTSGCTSPTGDGGAGLADAGI